MSDQQLERLANKHKIPSWGRAGEHGEDWYVDRERIIRELVAMDNAMRTRVFVIVAIVTAAAAIIGILFALLRSGQ